MKAKLFANNGKVKGDFSFSKDLDVKSNKSLIDQVVRVYEDNTHFGLNRVKTRSEVNISKRKIYKQKGTGGARHGAKSAHIFVGGGVVHGPTGTKRILGLTNKMKQISKMIAFNSSIQNNKVVLVEDINKLQKTKDVNVLLGEIKKETKTKGNITVVLSEDNKSVRRYVKNIENVKVFDYKTLNTFNIISSNLLVVDVLVFADKPVKKEVKIERKKTIKIK